MKLGMIRDELDLSRHTNKFGVGLQVSACRTYPGVSRHETGDFFIPWHSCNSWLKVSSVVCFVRITSTSFICGTWVVRERIAC